MQTVQYTVGVPGAGKSYFRCARFLVDKWLPFHTGLHVSNFPVNKEALRAICSKRGLPADSVDRVRTLSREVLDKWMSEDSGPWETFDYRGEGQHPLSGAHIAIDEAHNYIGRHHSKEYRAKWQQWLGELRHLGASIEFLTQDKEKVAKEVIQHAEVRFILAPLGSQRDPILYVPFYDWGNLRAKLVGKWRAVSVYREEVKEGDKWKAQVVERVVLKPEYFAVYDSHNATESGQSGGTPEKREWERFSWLRLGQWFIVRNGVNVAWRSALIFGVIGGLCAVPFVLGRMGSISKAISEASKPAESNQPTVSERISTLEQKQPGRAVLSDVPSASPAVVANGIDWFLVEGDAQRHSVGDEVGGWLASGIDLYRGVRWVRKSSGPGGDEVSRVANSGIQRRDTGGWRATGSGDASSVGTQVK